MKNVKKYFSNTIKNYIHKKDHLVTGFLLNGNARFVFSDISNTIKDCKQRFEIKESNKLEQLGIAFNTSLILNSFLQGEERIELLAQYNPKPGILTTIYAESIATGEINGFIENSENNQIKTKVLNISKVLYNNKDKYKSIIELKKNELTEDDINNYFDESEQIKTFSNFFNRELGNDDFISQGFILQKMPGYDDKELKTLFRTLLDNQNFRYIRRDGLNVSTVYDLFKSLDIEVELKRCPINFHCRCSKEQFLNVLKSLGKETIEDMKQKEQNQIVCRKCNKKHFINEEDFKNLIN